MIGSTLEPIFTSPFERLSPLVQEAQASGSAPPASLQPNASLWWVEAEPGEASTCRAARTPGELSEPPRGLSARGDQVQRRPAKSVNPRWARETPPAFASGQRYEQIGQVPHRHEAPEFYITLALAMPADAAVFPLRQSEAARWRGWGLGGNRVMMNLRRGFRSDWQVMAQ
jgi:hypothetical protein